MKMPRPRRGNVFDFQSLTRIAHILGVHCGARATGGRPTTARSLRWWAPRQSAHDLLHLATRSQTSHEFTSNSSRSTMGAVLVQRPTRVVSLAVGGAYARRDRKSTRLNSSHVAISYAVFCL